MSADDKGQAPTGDFIVTRTLDAPRARVWAVLTEPEHMKVWWTPQTFTMIAMNMDFRPGGSFHMGMRSGEGYKMWGKFVYQEITPPERLVFVNCFSNQAGDHPPPDPADLASGIAVAVALATSPAARRTSMSTHSRIMRPKLSATRSAPPTRHEATWTRTFDRLAAYLAKTA